MARGGSAGGLLMGAVANLAPELFRAIVAEVPFVDCLTTILDETLPLTVLEWEEWGNPVEDPEIYRVMKSYSPYDNVRSVDAQGRPVRYPDILATGGLSDPRVGFWEPAKWVAKLRAANPDNRVLLKTELGCRPRWAVGPLRRLEGRGVRLRLHPRRPGNHRGGPGPRPVADRSPPGQTPGPLVVVVGDGDPLGMIEGAVVVGLAEPAGVGVDGWNRATKGVCNGTGSTTGMLSILSVTAGAPSSMVTGPLAGMTWT